MTLLITVSFGGGASAASTACDSDVGDTGAEAKKERLKFTKYLPGS